MEITTTTIRLRADDGEMKCHQAQPRGSGKFPTVIVIMEAFGLNDHIKDVAERIATEGYVVIAPDLYYRESPNVVRYDQLDAAIHLMQTLDNEHVMANLQRVITHLQTQTNVHGDRLGITGFCMGGTIAFLAACKLSTEIKAAVSFYGGGIGGDAPTAALGYADDLKYPILCIFGEDDQYIPLKQVKQIENRLRVLGKPFEVKIYPGAGHGFFCDERDSYHPEAAANAWENTMAWFKKYLKG